MKQLFTVVCVLLFSLPAIYPTVTKEKGKMISSIEIGSENGYSSSLAKAQALQEISDSLSDLIFEKVSDYIENQPEEYKPYYIEAKQKILLSSFGAGVSFSTDGKNVNATVSVDEFVNRNSLLYIDSLDKYVTDVIERENRMKAAMINGASKEDNETMALAAYYVYEYEKGRIAKQKDAIPSSDVIRSLKIADLELEKYLLIAAQQVEYAPSEIKNFVVKAALIKYIYNASGLF